MPTLRQADNAAGPRLDEPSDAVQSLARQPGVRVFYDFGTGEIFSEYEKFVEHYSLQSKPVWACRYTGKSGLTYSEALESENQSEAILEAFPESWKYFIFSLVQHCTPRVPRPTALTDR